VRKKGLLERKRGETSAIPLRERGRKGEVRWRQTKRKKGPIRSISYLKRVERGLQYYQKGKKASFSILRRKEGKSPSGISRYHERKLGPCVTDTSRPRKKKGRKGELSLRKKRRSKGKKRKGPLYEKKTTQLSKMS